MALRRPEVSVPGSPGSPPIAAFAGSDLAVLCPVLAEYLSSERWDDGQVRETSTLLLFVEGGVLKACLNDRALGRSAFVAGDGLDAVLAALERGLAGDCLDWRVKGASSSRKRR